MTDSNAAELLKKLLFDVQRLEWETDRPGSDMTLGDYEREEARLIEECVQAVAATLGADDGSRWHELFGTPERAAQTIGHVCQFTHGGELCDRCQAYLFDSCDRMLRLGSEQKIYDALLEWLRGDDR